MHLHIYIYTTLHTLHYTGTVTATPENRLNRTADRIAGGGWQVVYFSNSAQPWLSKMGARGKMHTELWTPPETFIQPYHSKDIYPPKVYIATKRDGRRNTPVPTGRVRYGRGV